MGKRKHSLNHYRKVYVDATVSLNDIQDPGEHLEVWNDFNNFIDNMQSIAVERYKRENNINE